MTQTITSPPGWQAVESQLDSEGRVAHRTYAVAAWAETGDGTWRPLTLDRERGGLRQHPMDRPGVVVRILASGERHDAAEVEGLLHADAAARLSAAIDGAVQQAVPGATSRGTRWSAAAVDGSIVQAQPHPEAKPGQAWVPDHVLVSLSRDGRPAHLDGPHVSREVPWAGPASPARALRAELDRIASEVSA